MKYANILWLLSLAALTGEAMAQERLELARYSIEVPASWASQVNGDQWMMHPAASANECGIAPAPSTGLTGDDARRQMWTSAVGSRRVLQSTPTEKNRDASGRNWTLDTAVIEEGGGAYVFLLGVVELNGRAEGFLVVSTPQAIGKYQNTIEAVFDSVRARASKATSAPPSGQPSPLGKAGPGRLAGVWTATTQELQYGVGGLANNAVVTELILFADGATLFGMPPEGLLGFDREAHRKRSAERWGTYTLRDKRLVITRAGKEQQYAVLANGALENRYVEGGQERTGARYLSRASLDGVRLDGEVRRKDHWPAPGNTSGIGTLRGCTFGKDGTFSDERLMWIVLPEQEGVSKQAHEARVAPGRGRYRLEHWTLVLEYDDGRVNQVSFVATDRDQPARGAILNGYPIEPRPW